MNKQKILMISDHALSPSGVGIQAKYLAKGLLETGKYEILQLGCAIKHKDYNTIKVQDDFYIKPIDGFGNPALIRSVILNEQPDSIIIFSDPRFFTWLFKMEDEIRSICPILWWHVWDNTPAPDFNNWMYDSVDAINCHSYLTYKMCKKTFPDKTRFIPHSFPRSLFFKMSKKEIKDEKARILGEKRKNNFVCLWMNRNCRRKRPGDVIKSWQLFLESLPAKEREKATLVMHTNPSDDSGQDLVGLAQHLGVLSNISFSNQNLPEEYVNILHNISDVCINISFNEGFGLTTLSSMMVGKPIIASKTGGLYRQVVDYRDNTENGVGLEIEFRSLVGDQETPYIYEDYVSCESISKAIKKVYLLSEKEKKDLENKVKLYTDLAFDYDKTIKDWDFSIQNEIQKHKNKKSSMEMITIK